jgi:hypothetical protein
MPQAQNDPIDDVAMYNNDKPHIAASTMEVIPPSPKRQPPQHQFLQQHHLNPPSHKLQCTPLPPPLQTAQTYHLTLVSAHDFAFSASDPTTSTVAPMLPVSQKLPHPPKLNKPLQHLHHTLPARTHHPTAYNHVTTPADVVVFLHKVLAHSMGLLHQT